MLEGLADLIVVIHICLRPFKTFAGILQGIGSKLKR